MGEKKKIEGAKEYHYIQFQKNGSIMEQPCLTSNVTSAQFSEPAKLKIPPMKRQEALEFNFFQYI